MNAMQPHTTGDHVAESGMGHAEVLGKPIYPESRMAKLH